MTVTNAASIAKHTEPRPFFKTDAFFWIVTGAAVLSIFILSRRYEWLAEPTPALTFPIDHWFNSAMAWFVNHFKWFFRTVSWALSGPMDCLNAVLNWLPWPVTIALVAILAHFCAGWRLALFCICALFYMVIVGYWEESMNTLALVGMAVPLSLILGLFIGILGFRYRRAFRIIEPTLDLMQTIPTFAYLVPIILLFGFGAVVGLIASAIYAMPPMVRNVMLGLSRVPSEVVESARMSGCSRRQLLWWVQLPSALPTVMMGVNQTIMAGLNMVIIAAIIGGYADIGWEVLNTMRKAEFGQSLLSGIVIALIAMIMDRISLAAALKLNLQRRRGSFWQRHVHLWIALGVIAVLISVGHYVAPLRSYPEAWIFYPAELLNEAVEWFTVNFFEITKGLKNGFMFLLLLPLQIGLVKSVTPFFWGFSMTLSISIAYAALVALFAAAAGYFLRWRVAIAVIIIGTLFYYGTIGIPWPAFILLVTILAFQVGGNRVALLVFLGLWFILLGGAWHRAMLSVYLCGAAVLISFFMGALLGIWVAHNDRLSSFLRPINDTLQTMPMFVFLVPILMVFLVGEFSAFLAIVAYSIVPAIRYTEHGIRNVPHEVVEASIAMGCTKRQLLFHVKLPLALPEIMLGLNQTVMFGLAMLVIAALIGTLGLGQMVYHALTNANFGEGTIAGLGIAIIAMITDRILQSWSHKKKIELGLA